MRSSLIRSRTIALGVSVSGARSARETAPRPATGDVVASPASARPSLPFLDALYGDEIAAALPPRLARLVFDAVSVPGALAPAG